MQHGQVGVVIIIASILLSVGGGFVLNTTDITACATDFTYITDVAGAFTGTQGNIEVDHNPAENLTGYSVYSPESTDFKSSTIAGISYTTTNPNVYWMQRATGDPDIQTLTISHNLSTTGSSGGRVTYNFGSGTSPTTSATVPWGLNNAEIRTVLFTDGVTHVRVVGVTVFDLVNAYKTWKDLSSLDTNKIRIYFDASTNEYPGFITNQSFDFYHSSGSGGYYGINTEVKYGTIQNDIVVNPTNGSVRIGDNSYSWTEVYAVWGESNSTSAAMTMILGGQVVTEYINPLNGIKPVSVTINDPTQEGETANAIHVGGQFTMPAQGERTCTYTISYRSTSTGEYVKLFLVSAVHFSNGYYAVISEDGPELYSGNQSSTLNFYWDWNSENPSIVKIWVHNSTMPSNAKQITVTNIPSEGIYQLNVAFDSMGTNISDISTILTNKSATPESSSTHVGGGSFQFVTTYSLPLEVTYTTTYWSNSVENSQIAMVFSKPSVNTDNIFFINYKQLDNTYVSEPIRMKYDSGNNGWYFYDSSTNAVNLGEWPGMMLTIKVSGGMHQYVLIPIQTFNNFQNYTLMNREYTYTTGASAAVSNPQYESVRYIQFNNTDQPYPYHEIVRTTIFLKDGGLYLNNGWFSPDISFPNDDIIQLRLMSAARAGESVTITVDQSGFAHDGNPIQIDGSEEYVYENIMLGYLPGGEWGTNTDIPGITIGTTAVGGTPHLWFSGQATTDGVYYVTVKKYNYPEEDTDYVLQFIVTNAENPSPYSKTFLTDSLGTGLYIDGILYPWGTISLYYVSEDVPAITIEEDRYAGGLYLFNTFLEKGHLYLIAGKSNHTVDLGKTTNAWSIQLNGLWALSTAYYTGENEATSVVVWDKPGTWQWDAPMMLITFLAANIIGMVVCTRFTQMELWDWVIPICACVVAVVLLG